MGQLPPLIISWQCAVVGFSVFTFAMVPAFAIIDDDSALVNHQPYAIQPDSIYFIHYCCLEAPCPLILSCLLCDPRAERVGAAALQSGLSSIGINISFPQAIGSSHPGLDKVRVAGRACAEFGMRSMGLCRDMRSIACPGPAVTLMDVPRGGSWGVLTVF